MRRFRDCFFLVTSCLLAASHASAQEKPAVLRCIFKGSVELHSTLEPSSPVIAKIACGTPLILLDHRSSSPHVRTKDGKDGYIISFNGGQWAVEPQTKDAFDGRSTAPPTSPTNEPPATQPSEVSASKSDAQPQPEPISQPVNERPAPALLTNSDIVDLIKTGVSSDVVIALIGSSRTNFDTATAALASLKKMDIPDAVLLAMVRAGGSAAVSKPLNDVKRSPDGPTEIFERLQTSVVTVWSEFGYGSGFIIERSGLILTNEHVVGASIYIAVQSDPTHKTPATIVATSREKNIAVLWANLEALPGTRAAPLPETKGTAKAAVEGERVLTIGSPLNQRKVMTAGIVRKVEPQAIISDISLNQGNSGGPLINSAGEVIGITSFADDTGGRSTSSIVRIEEAESLIADARALISQLPSPPGLSLPVDPTD